ncbi:MAG: FAD-dependent oxidoreductase [Flavobacteriaceae bacterium]|nr:FAD-dependent oxidoreductase [Flavobacteriaceae bacterium]
MVIIIGAGLSGLLTGYLLKKEGIPFKILESRHRVGGRINTLYSENKAPIELGATWFTSQHQHLLKLLETLDIPYFKQSIDDKVFYEASTAATAQLVQIPKQAPSYRISGGSSRLIQTLLKALDDTDVLIDQPVKHVKFDSKFVQVKTEKNHEGNVVVLALPPKLWAKNIEFEPQLPDDLMGIARQTQTWMEDAIKIGFTYEKPFWGSVNLPGTLFSNSGPITEFYDHSDHENSKFALCGFIDSSLKHLTYEERQLRAIKHLINVFGTKAQAFTGYEECVWSQENSTFEPADTYHFPHQNNGNPIFRNSYFDNRLFISSSESASEFPGYMDGAVCSAYATVKNIMKAQQHI